MANNTPRRTLQDLSFIYRHHPELRNVYVEGTSDRALINWFMRKIKLESVYVYTIETIEVPDGEIISSGRKANNRERLIFLAEFLQRSSATRATCVVDADFSHLETDRRWPNTLQLTDYSCIEMYFFTHENLSKFFSLCCKHDEWPVEEIMNALAQVLQELFLYRFANERMKWQMKWLLVKKCIRVSGWHIILNSDNHIRRYLRKNEREKDINKFKEMIEELRRLFRQEPRYQMHGHDFVYLLSWYIRHKGITDHRSSPDAVMLNLLMSADHLQMSKENMFRSLIDRLFGPSVQIGEMIMES